MDTKLKRVSYSPITKGIAVLLVAICFGLSITLFVNLVMHSGGFEALSQKNYLNTNELLHYQEDIFIGLDNLLKLESEENIKKGNTISKEEFENRKRDMFFEWYNQINENIYKDSSESGPNAVNSGVESRFEAYRKLKEKFETENADRIKNVYNSMIDNELRDYYTLLESVNNKEGLYYYGTNGKTTFTNCYQPSPEYFTLLKAYYMFDRGVTKNFPG